MRFLGKLVSTWRKSKTVLTYAITLVALALCLFPIYWLITTSLKIRIDTFSIPPLFLSFKPVLKHYWNVFVIYEFQKYVVNSLIISLTTTVLVVLIGAPAAFTLVRLKFRWRNELAFSILVVRMIPHISLAIPFYLMMRRIHLLDTYTAVIMTHTVFLLPFVIWLMRGFFMGIPMELEDAARIDGCSKIGSFVRIIIPLSTPGLITSAIFTFLGSWNEFLFALIIGGSKTRVVTTALTALAQAQTMGVYWEGMFAAATVHVLPVIVIAILVNKYFVKGLTMGAVKG